MVRQGDSGASGWKNQEGKEVVHQVLNLLFARGMVAILQDNLVPIGCRKHCKMADGSNAVEVCGGLVSWVIDGKRVFRCQGNGGNGGIGGIQEGKGGIQGGIQEGNIPGCLYREP